MSEESSVSEAMRQQARDYLEANPELASLEILTPDANGILRAKRIPRAEVETLFGSGLTAPGTTGLCDGSFSQDLNARWCSTCSNPTHNFGAGAVVQAQFWYRDPGNTSNQTTSLSDAIEFTMSP